MSEHFNGKYEVELKFAISSTVNLKQRLGDRRAEIFLLENQERDCYFELEDKKLENAGLSMVLRLMQPSNLKLWIIKGPGKDRCEAVKVESISKTKNMLNTLGYNIAFELLKTRSIYFVGQFHITLDHIEGLGDYAEIAVMTDDNTQLEALREQCLDCAEMLGLSASDIEPRSYRRLLGH